MGLVFSSPSGAGLLELAPVLCSLPACGILVTLLLAAWKTRSVAYLFPPALGTSFSRGLLPFIGIRRHGLQAPLEEYFEGRAPWPPAVQILDTRWSPHLRCSHLVPAREALLSRGRPRSRRLPQVPGAASGVGQLCVSGWLLMRAVMVTVMVAVAGLAAQEAQGPLGSAVTLLPAERRNAVLHMAPFPGPQR